MANKGWLNRVDEPIVLAGGTSLRTLQEAVAHLAETVPKAERDHPTVRTAATILTYAAEREAAWMYLARAATLQAIHRNVERVNEPAPERKKTHWGKRKLKRDL